jgi:hypothetical protein
MVSQQELGTGKRNQGKGKASWAQESYIFRVFFFEAIVSIFSVAGKDSIRIDRVSHCGHWVLDPERVFWCIISKVFEMFVLRNAVAAY